jgi:hypothetical protein
MAVSHNIYIRGLNAIYNQAGNVTSPTEVRDFLTFCQIWLEVIQHHHSLEEEAHAGESKAASGFRGGDGGV